METNGIQDRITKAMNYADPDQTSIADLTDNRIGLLILQRRFARKGP